MPPQILQQRGETNEALRIYQRDLLPVLDRYNDVHSRAVVMGEIADILERQGDIKEALRIYNEELLPVYHRLGDLRSRSITMGKIANIVRLQGDPNEALRIHLEERLPLALAMQDHDTIAHVRYLCALIRLNRREFSKGEEQIIYDELAESFKLSKRIQRIDFIASIGAELGKVLARGGQLSEAQEVLRQSAAAFDKLKFSEERDKILRLIEKISLMEESQS